MEYILLTPARNEEHDLPNAAQAVITQSQRPVLWLIVNDGSTDRTPEIIQNLEKNYPWIISRTLPVGVGGLGKHYAEVVKYGFTQLQVEAAKRGITYDLIGKIDADVFFEPACFLSLTQEFEKDASLGIASPHLIVYDKARGFNEGEVDLAFTDHPTDGVRLYRRQCFEEIGGMHVVRGPETVAQAKAIIKGWKLRQFDQLEAKLLRKAHSSTSLWARYMMAGSEAHYFGYNLLLVLGRCVFEALFRRPHYLFLAYGWGYLRGFIKHEPKIEDAEILAYFGSQRLGEEIPQTLPLLRQGCKRWFSRPTLPQKLEQYPVIDKV